MNLLLHAAHGGGVADKPIEADGACRAIGGRRGTEAGAAATEDRVFAAQTGMFDSLLDGDDQLIPLERLGHVVEGAKLEGFDRGFHAAEGGHDDDRELVVVLADLAEQIESGAAGHLEVGDDRIGPFARDGFDRGGDAVGSDDVQAGPRKGASDAVAEHFFVIDDENRWHNGRPPWHACRGKIGKTDPNAQDFRAEVGGCAANPHH